MAYQLGHFTSNFNLAFITVGCNQGIFWFPDGSDPLRDSITYSYSTFFGRYGEQGGVEFWVNLWVNGDGQTRFGGSVSNMIQQGGVDSGELGKVALFGRHSGMSTGACPISGCTNPNANNYNPSATVDNGSCTFNPPTLVNFNIDRQDGSDAGVGTVPFGQSVTLRWNVTGVVTSVSIDGGIGTVPNSGTRVFSPSSSGTYIFRITATGPGGTTTGQYGFTVAAPPPPYVSFNISVPSIIVGDTATLLWSTSGVVSSVSINQGIGSVLNSGTRVVAPTTPGTYVYIVTASGPGGTVQENVSLLVSNPPPPSVNFFASSTTVARGYPVTLNWSVGGRNVTGISIDNGIGAVSPTGSLVVYPSTPPTLPWALTPAGSLEVTTTYTITAVNAGGSTVRQAVVTIRTPIVVELSGSETIVAGDVGYLQWIIAGDHTNLVINNGVGNVSYDADRRIEVYPTTTTTYALTATSISGTLTTDYHTITVLPTRPMATLNFTSPGTFNLPATITEFNYTVEGGGGGGGGYDAGSPGGTGGSGGRVQGTAKNLPPGASIQVYVGRGGGAGAGGVGNGSGGSGASNSFSSSGGSGGTGGNSGPGGWSGAGGGGGAAGVLVYSGTVLVVAGGGGGGGGGGNDGGYNPFQTGGNAGGLSTSLSLGNGGNAPNHGGDGGGGGGGGGGSPGGGNGFTPVDDKDAGGGSGGGSYYNLTYHTSAPSFSTGPGGGGSETKGTDGVLTVIYAEDDAIPNPIADFTSIIDATPSTTYNTTTSYSGNRTITGINVPVSASATNGATIIKNGVNLGTSTATVVNNDVLGLSMISSSSFSSSKTTTLIVGAAGGTTVNANWNIITADLPTSVPNPYDFTDQTDVGLSTLVTSNEVTISGMTGTNVPISATASTPGGISVPVELIIGGVGLGSGTGTINNGQTLRLRMTSASVIGTATTALVTIGAGASVDWIIQTVLTVDTGPDFFNFINQTGVAAGTAIDSNVVTITGINSPAEVATTSGALVNINGAGFVTPTSTTTITNNQTLQLRLTSSSTPTGSASTTVSIGNPATGQVTDDWSIETTSAGDTTPDDFAFVNKLNQLASTVVYSNTVVIQGITSPATVAISGASGAQFSIDGGAYTSTSTPINDGQTLSLKFTTGAYGSPIATVNIAVGTLSRSWSISVLGSAPSSSSASTWYNADIGKKLDGLAIGTVISIFKDATGSWGTLDGSLTSRYPGFIVCEGQSLNAVDYPDLFAVIENRYGGTAAVATSGSTKTYSGSFKLPNYRNRKIMGTGNVDGNSVSSPMLPTANGPAGTGSGGGTVVGSEGGSWFIAKLDASGPYPREQVFTGGQDGEFFKLGTIRTTGYDEILSSVGFNISGNTTQTVGPLQERIVTVPSHTHEIITATASAQTTGLIPWLTRATFGGNRRVATNNLSGELPGGPSLPQSFGGPLGGGTFIDMTISYSNYWLSDKNSSVQLDNSLPLSGRDYLAALDVNANTANSISYSPPAGIQTHSHYLSLNTFGSTINVFGWGNDTGGGKGTSGMPLNNTVSINFTTSELGSTLNDGNFLLSNSKALIPTVNLRPNKTVPLMTRYFKVKYLIKAY